MTSAQIAIMTTIILYLCLVIFTGVMIGKRSKKSAEGFYLGGRGMGPLVTAMSAEASDMSSYLLMGIPGLAYLSGVADASWTAIGLAIGTYLNFLLVARRLRRYSVELDAITIPSFISKRYGEKKPIIMGIASLVILVFFVPYVASGLAAIGKLFNSLFGWNYMLSVIVGAIVIISYTSVGGFSAVATMDLIQSVIMTVALCVIVVFGIVQAGGMDAVLAHADSLPGFLSFGQTYNAASGQAEPYGLIRIVSMLAWGLGYFGMPHILVRFMAIRHEDELKLSRRIASIWVVISMAVAVFIGIVGHAVSNVGRIPMLEGSATETVIVRLSDLLSSYGLLPAIVAGCILAGILAATMSTADSQLLAAASAFSENVLQDVFGVKLTAKQNMVAARLTVVVIAFIAIFLAAGLIPLHQLLQQEAAVIQLTGKVADLAVLVLAEGADGGHCTRYAADGILQRRCRLTMVIGNFPAGLQIIRTAQPEVQLHILALQRLVEQLAVPAADVLRGGVGDVFLMRLPFHIVAICIHIRNELLLRAALLHSLFDMIRQPPLPRRDAERVGLGLRDGQAVLPT